MSTKAQVFQQACRARPRNGSPLPANLWIYRKNYATQNTSSAKPTRRAISVTTDDGRYHWSELTTGEKAARTTQQSFNFLFVTAGALGTIAVSYLLYQELFAADSKTRQFNRAVDRVKADPRCREILGPAKEIRAYGEPTTSKWARARPLAHNTETDRAGTTHFRMHFNVEGPNATGMVYMHMTKKSTDSELEYQILSLSVPGHETIYLENADAKNPKKALGKMFGVRWG